MDNNEASEAAAVAVYTFRMRPELKLLLDRAAAEQSRKTGRRVTINEVAAEILAGHFGHPEFARIDRGTPGRPPKNNLMPESAAQPA